MLLMDIENDHPIPISPFIVGLAWYDNEWGYSNRCVDLAIFMGQRLNPSGKSVGEKFAARA